MICNSKHNMDSSIERKIQGFAKDNHFSLNKAIQLLLRKALNINYEQIDKSENFREFLGIWNKKDNDDFNKSLKRTRSIDLSDWK